MKEKGKNDYGIIILDDEYVNNLTKLKFICLKHKDKGVQFKSWGNIITKKCACIYCSKELTHKETIKSKEEFEFDFYNIHGKKYKLLSDYDGCKVKVKVHCNMCNNDFTSAPNHLLEGHGCPNCVKSKGENRIETVLQSLNIEYIREYRFDDCIGTNRSMPFDFYLPKYNLCIEYQGEQHYHPIDLFGGEKQFKIQQKNDNIKKTYCKHNNIELLCIPFWEFNNIENIIKNITGW